MGADLGQHRTVRRDGPRSPAGTPARLPSRNRSRRLPPLQVAPVPQQLHHRRAAVGLGHGRWRGTGPQPGGVAVAELARAVRGCTITAGTGAGNVCRTRKARPSAPSGDHCRPAPPAAVPARHTGQHQADGQRLGAARPTAAGPPAARWRDVIMTTLSAGTFPTGDLPRIENRPRFHDSTAGGRGACSARDQVGNERERPLDGWDRTRQASGVQACTDAAGRRRAPAPAPGGLGPRLFADLDHRPQGARGVDGHLGVDAGLGRRDQRIRCAGAAGRWADAAAGNDRRRSAPGPRCRCPGC